MRVKALFHGILSDWVGVPRAEIDLPEGGKYADLLAAIRKNYGQNMPAQLWSKDQEAFNRAIWAMRGKERLSEMSTRMNDGEEVQFFLSLAGG